MHIGVQRRIVVDILVIAEHFGFQGGLGYQQLQETEVMFFVVRENVHAGVGALQEFIQKRHADCLRQAALAGGCGKLAADEHEVVVPQDIGQVAFRTAGEHSVQHLPDGKLPTGLLRRIREMDEQEFVSGGAFADALGQDACAGGIAHENVQFLFAISSP